MALTKRHKRRQRKFKDFIGWLLNMSPQQRLDTLIARDFIRSKKGNSKYPCTKHDSRLTAIETEQKVRQEWLEEFKGQNEAQHATLAEKLDKLNGGG